MSILLGTQIFHLIDSGEYTENIDEKAILKEMDKKISSFLNLINMENNILLSQKPQES